MTQGERVRTLRKTLGLTLENFAKPIGVKKAAISNIENDIRGLTDQMIISICREHHANEEWLRTGEGEMFVPLTRNQVITDFAADLIKEKDSFKSKLIEALANLSEDEWKVLEKLATDLANKKGQG